MSPLPPFLVEPSARISASQLIWKGFSASRTHDTKLTLGVWPRLSSSSSSGSCSRPSASRRPPTPTRTTLGFPEVSAVAIGVPRCFSKTALASSGTRITSIKRVTVPRPLVTFSSEPELNINQTGRSRVARRVLVMSSPTILGSRPRASDPWSTRSSRRHRTVR